MGTSDDLSLDITTTKSGLADSTDANDEIEHVTRSTDDSAALRSRPFDIFISYRVKPDEALAAELRTLLESSIEPMPRVFVSGVGGLRVGPDGFRQQIQRAAQEVRAFIGLITQASVEREWLFFEAGAAFGRGVTYAPLLIDAAPGDLPSSIGGYQAVTATDVTNVSSMIRNIAQDLGATMKSHFGQRYARFARALERYGKDPTEETSPTLLRAMKLGNQGRTDEADEIFATLLAESSDDEEKARIEIARAISRKDSVGTLAALPQVPSMYHQTAMYNLWRGDSETSPTEAIRCLRLAKEGKLVGFFRSWAVRKLSEKLSLVGNASEANTILEAELRSEDRRVRSDVAVHIQDSIDYRKSFTRLLLYLIALVDDGPSARAISFCWHDNWTAIGLYLASVHTERIGTGSAYLNRGLLRAKSGLTSLAYRDYSMASEAGVSVAKPNMAQLVMGGPVHEAGLQIMRSHASDFDSARAEHPYQVRAQAELGVANEEAAEQRLITFGRSQASALQYVAESILQKADQPNSERSDAQYTSGAWRVNFSDPFASATRNGLLLQTEALWPFKGLYASSLNDEVVLLFWNERGAVHGLSLVDLRKGGDVATLAFDKQSDSTTALQSAEVQGIEAPEPAQRLARDE